MADPRFYNVKGPFRIEELADIGGAKLGSLDRADKHINDVAPLKVANEGHVSFIDNKKYVPALKNTGAGAVILSSELIERAPKEAVLLITSTPYIAYAKIAQAFYPEVNDFKRVAAKQPISPSSIMGENVTLGCGVVIGNNVRIGKDSCIGNNSVIDCGVELGENSWVGANVSLSHCIIGNRAIIHSGSSIGQDGFGFAPSASGHVKIPQLGRVLIGKDVEIGANVCIDRGSAIDTEIGDGTKLDNLVQIGHNVKVGKSCMFASQVGVAGSTSIGDFVMIGGQAGIAGHIRIGNGVRIAAKSGVTKDVPSNQTIAGFPAINAKSHWRRTVALNNLAEQQGGK